MPPQQNEQRQDKTPLLYRLEKGVRHFLYNQPLNSSTEIRLTRLCTQRCRQCSVYERKTIPASLNKERFQILAERLKTYGAHIGFVSGGEATLVPDLIPILQTCKTLFPVATTLVTGLYNQTDRMKTIAKFCLDNDINIQTSLDAIGPLGDYLRGAKHFSDTVLKHMDIISCMKKNSKSLLYTNIVINNLNLDQVPELIAAIKNRGWKATIGMYHHLTETTRKEDELELVSGQRLERLVDYLDGNTDILNLNAFIRGIKPFIEQHKTTECPFVAAKFSMTRPTIMENGDVHLCWGDPIGNLFEQDLETIFSQSSYRQRLQQYAACRGCWTTCYTQRYLLIHPRTLDELLNNVIKIIKLKRYSQ